jgi:hypothetical protein
VGNGRLTLYFIVEFTASLSSLGKICWMRLEDGVVRFTIIPDQGTQVWAQLPIVCLRILLLSTIYSIAVAMPLGTSIAD